MKFQTNSTAAERLNARLLEKRFRVYKAFYHASKGKKALVDYVVGCLPDGFYIQTLGWSEEEEMLGIDLVLEGMVNGQHKEAFFVLKSSPTGSFINQVDGLPDRS